MSIATNFNFIIVIVIFCALFVFTLIMIELVFDVIDECNPHRDVHNYDHHTSNDGQDVGEYHCEITAESSPPKAPCIVKMS